MKRMAKLGTGGVAALLLLIGGGGIAAGMASRAPDPLPSKVAKAAPRPKPRPAPAAVPAPAEPAPYVIKSAMQIDGPLRHGDWHWREEGVAQGPMLITVDLQAQTLSVFRDGHEIGVAVILYGADDKPSPLGVFPITQKKRHHISNLYNAPMPYMLRLTNDGVAIHASDVAYGAATHGCIGVPSAFAAKLFAQVKLGDRVIITSGERLQVGVGVSAT